MSFRPLVLCCLASSLRASIIFPFHATLPLPPPYALYVDAPSASSFSLLLRHDTLGPTLSLSQSATTPFLLAARVNASYAQHDGTFVFAAPLSQPLSSCSDLLLASAASADGVAVLSGSACGGRGAWSVAFEGSTDGSGHVSWSAAIHGGSGTGAPAIVFSPTVPQSPLLGLGTQFSTLDLRGRTIPVWSREQGVGRGLEPVTSSVDAISPGAGGDATTTYSHMPLLYVVGKNATTALWLEALDRSEFDLQTPGRAAITQLGNATHGRVTVSASLSGAAESYTSFSGRPPPSPAWAEEGAIIGLEGGTDSVLATLAAIDSVEPHAPIAGVWLQDWSGCRNDTAATDLPFYGVYWSWAVNASLYPRWHTELLPALDARGARVLVYVNPMLMHGALFDYAIAHDYIVRVDGGDVFYYADGVVLVNVFSPPAASWFARVIADNVLSATGARASGYMADFGEAFPPNALGARSDAHGRFPAAWAAVNAAASALANRSENTLFWMRSSSPTSPGISPSFWLGDQLTSWDASDGLASAVIALMTSSLSGAGIAHADIGGYTAVSIHPPFGNISICRDKELFMRWAEFAAFTFLFRTHLGNNPRVNWQLTSDAETTRHFFAMARVFVSLREHRARVRATATEMGTPPFVPTAALFPTAPWGLVSQYLYGRDLLVAPVLRARASSVNVWLPPHTVWRHALNASLVVVGEGRAVDVAAPLGMPCALWRVT